jgi:metal-responsive CopG/Arc/MetJ family transcriptional regulator
MPRISISLDTRLLRAIDQAARRSAISRSAFVRDSIRHYLAVARTKELERLEREGYLRHPDSEDDLRGWEQAAAKDWKG